MPRSSSRLSIGAVAEQTDVSVDVLRSWEVRFGFPSPDRSPSGHRRYSPRHVAEIQEVLRQRAAGLSLEAAIGRARGNGRRPSSTSVFAELRRRWPEQPVHVLSKGALTAISRAIEDECCARAERPVLAGCFQHEAHYRASESRWRELARTASWAAVFADFPRTVERRGRATEVAVAHDDPLLRDWAVICDSPTFAACVAGVELASDDGRGRRFEALWSIDPLVVRDAARVIGVLAGAVPGAADVASASDPVVDPAVSTRTAHAVMARTVAYLDGVRPA